MQTFLPHPNFKKTAKLLDYRRLGKQRVEAWQILNTLRKIEQGVTTITTKTGKVRKLGWTNHPAVLMWKGYESALTAYYNTMIREWVARGYNNTMEIIQEDKNIVYPKWLGDKDFHGSHRANLLRKDHEFYSKYGWSESSDLPYIWPVERSK
jgi:hypothetical protein